MTDTIRLEAEWILVVDDDSSNLRMASKILTEQNMRVSCLKSGEEAISFLLNAPPDSRPDLILLDVNMPGMDGFETMHKLRADASLSTIPVIFLTASDDAATEEKGLAAGAMDFIRKPFVPEVLLLRVRHTIKLVRLQSSLEQEVDRQTAEIREQNERIARMTLQIVQTLSGAIDAKDAYTNGHSLRVAEYSREIARRAGWSEQALNDLYMAALLHDVGKIGIPDDIINKTEKLSDEEYAQIRNHPALGAKILSNITDYPWLSVGAHYHHERFDGHGYPEGLKGESIPETARIIAVADSYDAMASRRSYRDVLPQAIIRAEMQECSGTQFDPCFAQIMIQMIDEDTAYMMREK
ncbi:MAG: response regulator [Treponema sp.]|nr:response regulator [Treponema sp.]